MLDVNVKCQMSNVNDKRQMSNAYGRCKSLHILHYYSKKNALKRIVLVNKKKKITRHLEVSVKSLHPTIFKNIIFW